MTTTTQKFASLMPFSPSGVTENIGVDGIHGDNNTSTSATVASLSSSTLNSIASGIQQTALCATAYRKQQKQLYDNNAEHPAKRRNIYSLGFDSNNISYLTTSAKPIFKSQQNNLTRTKILPFSTSTTLNTTSSTFNQQQHDSDCGSSSGLGETNNCSSDSSLLDSDSRDSGSGSNSAVNKIPDITSTLTPASVIATGPASGIPTLSTIPLTISNMLPSLQPVLNTILPPLSAMPPLPLQLNSNAPHLLSTTNFVGSSATSLFTGTRPLNRVITTSTLPLNNTNGKQWPSTSVLPPALSHPSATSPVKPLYTMTCEAAAIAAAAAAAAAGYHVSYGTDCWLSSTNQSDNTACASGTSNLSNSINSNVNSTSLSAVFNGSNASTSNANNLSSIPSNIATAISSGHDLFVHIHPGDAISLAVGNEIQHIPGPATIRMVSQSAPPSAIPMNVAPGHVVQQLLDRQGMLSHVIMSQETPNIVNVGSSVNGLPAAGSVTLNTRTNSTNYNSHQKTQNSCAKTLQKSQITQQQHQQQQAHSCEIASSVLQQQPFLVQQQHTSPISTPPSMLMACPSIFTSNSNDTYSSSTSQRKWNTMQNNNTNYASLVTPVNSKRGSANSNSSATGVSSNVYQLLENTSYYLPSSSGPNKTVQSVNSCNESPNENETIHYNIEDDEKDRLRETLNNIQSPTVTRIGARDADISWQELDTSEAAASGGPFPQIDASEFTYEIFVYEGQQTSRCIMQHRCSFSVGRSNTPATTSNLTTTASAQANTLNNVFCLTRLKPGTDYLVNIRASLLERELCGNSSPHTLFRTLACQPDAPQMPKLMHRQLMSSFTVSWKQPATNGSPINAYFLQLTKNKTENFETVYEGLSEQWKFVDPDPNAYYRFRVIARNEFGNSEPSTSLIVTPSAMQMPSQSPLINNQLPSLLNSHHLAQQSHHHGILSNIGHHLSQSSKSHIIFQKLSPPTVLSVSARAIRLSWNYSNEFFSVTLEMCNFTRANPNIYNPIPSECYASSGTFASINGLQTNREYRFRLVGLTQNGESLRSDYVSVKTHKDRYENAPYHQNYQQQQQLNHYPYSTSQLQNSEKEYRVSTPVQLHRYYDDENCVEIGWKFTGRDYENIAFIVEGTTLPVNNDENTLLMEKHWIVCYRGTANNATIQDPYLCLFRVQAINSCRHITSAWSETLLVKRVLQQKKNFQQQHLQQKISQQLLNSQNDNSQKQQEIVKETVENQSIKKIEEQKLKPVHCTTPKFSNITYKTAHVSWGVNDDSTKTDKIANINASMIYELQRVDKQPPIIIYSGNEFEFELKNLKTIEHMQLRVRSVILDAEGKRMEGDWSSVGSACTLCTVTSAPRNLKLGRKNNDKKNIKVSASVSSSASSTEPNTPEHHVDQRSQILTNKSFVWLNWNLPLQLNGSDVTEFIILASRYTLTDESDKVDNVLTNFLLQDQDSNKTTNGVLIAENEKIGSTSDTFYLAENLAPAQRYFFYVCAKNEAGISPKSNIVEYTSPASVPDAPQNFKAESLSISEIKLNWNASKSNGSLITLYKITVQKLINPLVWASENNEQPNISNSKHHVRVFVGQHFVPADKTSFIVSSLETETFLIEAENSVGISTKEKIKCSTLSPPPNPPILTLAGAQANGLKLKWTNSAQSTTKSDVCYYYLEKENENGTFSRVYEGELHSAKIKGLKERSAHRFRIRAALARNVMLSAWSTIYEFFTIRQPPPGLRSAPVVSELGSGIFQVEWQPLRCVNLLQSTSSGTKDESQQQHNQLIYRLQISSKMSRDKTTAEPWRTAYEGTASICTLNLYASVVTRQARVLVVQKYYINDQDSEDKKLVEIEESVSAPSPITIFSTTRFNVESSSPKKRAKTSLNYASTSNNALRNNVTGAHVSVHPGSNKISLNRRLKRFISWTKKTISEKDCALIVLIVFVLLAISIAILLNNYYQF